MGSELLLALFIMCVGFCVAAAGSNLYHAVLGAPAILRYDGKTVFGMLGNLVMSLVCGPYIMLRMGLRHEEDGSATLTSVLVGSAVAFGWAFVTGLLFMGSYVAVFA